MKKHVLVDTGLALGLAGLLLAGLALSVRAASRPGLGSAPSLEMPPANVSAQAWEATAAGEETEFLVILADQANLDEAAALPSREARLRYVYHTLRETAVRSQPALRAELHAEGVDYQTFYIVNMLAVQGDRKLVARLAARADVARIAANPRIRQPLPEPQPTDVRPMAPEAIEWGVSAINADDVWALGYSGTNIVVAGQDTGYDWDHPALINQYRGYNGLTATHDYNWHDAIHSGGGICGADSPVPCDDYFSSHGTHTMGTIVGGDGGNNQIGVAPEARWIGCRNMDQGVGTPARYAECFEFFLAPYPIGGGAITDGVPSLAPHVINNSWGCPVEEGCDADAIQMLQTVVENVRAAGIVVVAAAGNDGNYGQDDCESVREPAGMYDAAFSVGAVNSSDNVAGFSSRGPVTVDDSGRRKPDVSAPGVTVRSSVRDAGYNYLSGTSMAAPHVAGTVALLWSAAPHLIGDVDTTEWIIAQTARPRTTTQECGDDSPGDVPNNVYGWGIVDALAAVQGGQPSLEIAKQAAFLRGVPARLLAYTISVTNASAFTLTEVALTDTMPTSTTLSWASGTYTQVGSVLTWTIASLGPQATLTARLAVTVEHLPRGTSVVNSAYGAYAREMLAPVMGKPMSTVIPWRYLLYPVFNAWPSGEE